MKKITRIHLAKTAFSVEIDAKKSLEKYARRRGSDEGN